MSYCTVEDIRAEGFTEEDCPDEVVERLIKLSRPSNRTIFRAARTDGKA